MAGRLDASQVEKAKDVMEQLNESIQIDLSQLDYISSAGIGLFISTHTRLAKINEKMTIINPNELVRNIFHLSRLDQVFDIR